MITADSKIINGKKYIEGKCLSTDTKPTDNICNGSTLLEMNTSDLYAFDEASNTWLKL